MTFIRWVVYLMYKAPHHYQKFVSLNFALSVYWNCVFGFWTIQNFALMVDAPVECNRTPFSLIKLSYHITLIFGAFPAIICTVGTLFFACFLPYFIYERFQSERLRRQERAATKKIFKTLFRAVYDPRTFTFSDECCICLTNFADSKGTVVALPCDSRHYFHDRCIENWLKYHRACPFCKTEITQEAIDKTS